MAQRWVIGSGFLDVEDEQARLGSLLLQDVAGLGDQVRDIEGRKRVGALDHELVAGRKPGQRLARLEGGQGAAQAAQVEDGLRHRRNGLARGRGVKADGGRANGGHRTWLYFSKLMPYGPALLDVCAAARKTCADDYPRDDAAAVRPDAPSRGARARAGAGATGRAARSCFGRRGGPR